jgi:hypothetical protein
MPPAITPTAEDALAFLLELSLICDEAQQRLMALLEERAAIRERGPPSPLMNLFMMSLVHSARPRRRRGPAVARVYGPARRRDHLACQIVPRRSARRVRFVLQSAQRNMQLETHRLPRGPPTANVSAVTWPPIF